MKRIQAIALFTALTLSLAAARAQQLRTIITYTSGFGSASETDRDLAISEATQTAQNWANSTCTGMVTDSNTTTSTCAKLSTDGDGNVTWLCSVTVKDRCEIEYRGR
jgi:glycine cleavage system H lipoate-binding protein